MHGATDDGSTRTETHTREIDECLLPDEPLAQRGLYGRGIYFTTQSCKAVTRVEDNVGKRVDGRS